MSGEFTEHADIRYTTKELLADIRADLRAMNVKMELKADRETVHKVQNDIAAIRLESERRLAIIDEFRREQARNDRQDDAIASLEQYRNRIIGAVGVLTVVLGSLIVLMIWAFEHQ